MAQNKVADTPVWKIVSIETGYLGIWSDKETQDPVLEKGVGLLWHNFGKIMSKMEQTEKWPVFHIWTVVHNIHTSIQHTHIHPCFRRPGIDEICSSQLPLSDLSYLSLNISWWNKGPFNWILPFGAILLKNVAFLPVSLWKIVKPC